MDWKEGIANSQLTSDVLEKVDNIVPTLGFVETNLVRHYVFVMTSFLQHPFMFIDPFKNLQAINWKTELRHLSRRLKFNQDTEL